MDTKEVYPNSKGDTPTRKKPRRLSAAEVFERFAVAGGVRGIATSGPSGRLTRMDWHAADDPNPAQRLAVLSAGKKPAYFTPSVFGPAVRMASDRNAANVVAVQSFWIDIEGVPGKGGYDNLGECLDALGTAVGKEFAPCILVQTGSGGVHGYWLLDVQLPPAEWLPRAKAFRAHLDGKGLRIDGQCTTDISRLMRAPGSLHQRTGVLVEAVEVRPEAYTLAEFDALAYSGERDR